MCGPGAWHLNSKWVSSCEFGEYNRRQAGYYLQSAIDTEIYSVAISMRHLFS